MNSLKLEISLSLGLHFIVIAAFLFAGPLISTKQWKPGDVIRVSLSAGPKGMMTPPVMTPAKSSPVPAVAKPTPISSNAKALPGKKATKEQPKTKTKSGVRRDEEARFEAERAQNEIQTEATGEGSPFSGATVDNASFDYPYWFTPVFFKIQSNWVNTVTVDGEIVCVIYFQVIKSGRLLEAKVETSSGIERFDQGCLAAIQKSAPFPPLPNDFTDEIIGITLPFKLEAETKR